MRFEWDEVKNEANKEKHGIDFADARYVFADPLYKERYDGTHSGDEDRWVVIGLISHEGMTGAVVLVTVTYRPVDVVRIISARYAGAAERRAYYG